MAQFPVSDLLEIVAFQSNVSLVCQNIDDVCWGMVLQQDSPLMQFYTGHKDVYNFNIKDGNPIQLIRTPVGNDLIVDLDITESECILRNKNSPRVNYTNIDPMALPREVELQYIDPDRLYAVNTQPAVHHGASRNHGKLSVSVAFIISNDQARKLAYDLLYRVWARKLTIAFEHPNPNIEPCDVIQLTGNRGQHIMVVQDAVLTKERTTQVKGQVLLTELAGDIVIAAGFSDGTPTLPS